MRCIAIDDEPLALSIISQFCERKGGIELNIYNNPETGIQCIIEQKPELVFLDIKMNGMSGLEIASRLPEECCLVFTTAYSDYALDGFEHNAIDFLHKPFSYCRFEKAVNKAAKVVQLQKLAKKQKANETITVKVEYRNVTIPTDHILYIKAMENYSRIHQTNGRSILSQINLKNIMQMLPQNEFIRVHKSYIVPLNKILSYTKTQLILSPNHIIIPIGRVYANSLL